MVGQKESREMGFWESIASTTDTLKRSSPGLTSVKNACLSGRDYSSAAVSSVDNAVRGSALPKLYPYYSDDRTRAEIGLFASKFAKNAAYYAAHDGYKFIPGGEALAKIVNETIHDVRESRDGLGTRKPLQENGGGRLPPCSTDPAANALLPKAAECESKLEYSGGIQGKKKLQEETTIMKQQNEASTECPDQWDPSRDSSDSPKQAQAPSKVDAKRVFIRSRL